VAIRITTVGGTETICDTVDRKTLDAAIKDYLETQKDSLWCCTESSAIGSDVHEHCFFISKIAGYTILPKEDPDDEPAGKGFEKPSAPGGQTNAPA
jgi:hypothetical protein